MTTGATTSQPTKQPEDGCQVAGYSHSTDETTSHSTDKTTSHPTKQPKDSCQVVGYRSPNNGNQVAGYKLANALHSHSAKSPAEELLTGHPKDSDISRWLTLTKSLVNDSQVHPQGVHRKGRQNRCQSKTGRSLHRRGCKGLKPLQHTQAGYDADARWAALSINMRHKTTEYSEFMKQCQSASAARAAQRATRHRSKRESRQHTITGKSLVIHGLHQGEVVYLPAYRLHRRQRCIGPVRASD